LIEKEVFELEYAPEAISLEEICEKIEALGMARNLPYKAQRVCRE
jgi:hypothetical protein